MAYKGESGGGGGVYCAIVVHQYCNNVRNAGGRGIKGMLDSCTKALK